MKTIKQDVVTVPKRVFIEFGADFLTDLIDRSAHAEEALEIFYEQTTGVEDGLLIDILKETVDLLVNGRVISLLDREILSLKINLGL